ncbi:alpha/beta hydrolase [Amycolatopsis sp., V23-08]|uniref:Alpha/beta hydrolase n=1 Tax=Amycolatopsis heterodermiae TaxID=3110235 RepID=A0ABU5R5E9_9PSEU|nr:alpha/beta hydrolase [Amycolatopsis sp., V23-08]MEA5360910.1 alpha/beta hydrolase [Amycolatopsis sp., V23-08]
MTDQLTEWHRHGATTTVPVRGVPRAVFHRVSGSGRPLVLLHGFPASSFEWARVEPLVARRHTVVTFDFLGFGASEKPRGHRYSVFEQADLAEALIGSLGFDAVTLVAYDYGAIVASELLARDRSFTIDRCVFLNAGLYADQYRPRLIQRASLWPVAGNLLARSLTERQFFRSWSRVFSPEHPLDPELAGLHYRALRAGDPDPGLTARLLRYIPERAAHRDRLEPVFTGTPVPLSFLWGMRDPVSGPRVARELRSRNADADIVEYPDLGHCPHIEAPERVTADILARSDVRPA